MQALLGYHGHGGMATSSRRSFSICAAASCEASVRFGTVSEIPRDACLCSTFLASASEAAEELCDSCHRVVEGFYEEWTRVMMDQQSSIQQRQGGSEPPAVTYNDETEAMVRSAYIHWARHALWLSHAAKSLLIMFALMPHDGTATGAGLLRQQGHIQRRVQRQRDHWLPGDFQG